MNRFIHYKYIIVCALTFTVMTLCGCHADGDINYQGGGKGNIEVKDIEFLPQGDIYLAVGSKQTLTAFVYPSDAAYKEIKWEIGNPAPIDLSVKEAPKGSSTVELTGKNEGSCLVEAIVYGTDGKILLSAVCNVFVSTNYVPVTNVNLNETDITLDVGQSFTLTADILPENATNKTVTWSSSNTNIAAVNSTTGVVTALSEGAAIITATTADVTADCSVTVVAVVITEYTVTFDTYGGNDAISPQIVKEGEKVNVPMSPTRDGYVFEGWYTELALTNRWNFDTDVVTENITLYAKWTEATSPVTFNVTVPAGTPIDAKVYIVGTMNNWNPSADQLTRNGNGTYSISLGGITAGDEYRYVIGDCCGGWSYEELEAKNPGSGCANRALNHRVVGKSNTDINDVVDNWRYITAIECPHLELFGFTWSDGGNVKGWELDEYARNAFANDVIKYFILGLKISNTSEKGVITELKITFNSEDGWKAQSLWGGISYSELLTQYYVSLDTANDILYITYDVRTHPDYAGFRAAMSEGWGRFILENDGGGIFDLYVSAWFTGGE